MTLKVGLLAADLTHNHGWAHYSTSVAQALIRAGVQLEIVTTRSSPPHPDLAAAHLLPNVDPFDRGMLLRQFAALPAVRRALMDVDLIHCAVEVYAPLAHRIAGQRPLLITGHGTYVRLPQRRWVGGLYRRAFEASTLVCVSSYTAREASRILPAITPVVIPNGVDLARFGDLARQPAAAPTILFVGAVKTRKGVLELVRALPAVRAAIPDVRCVIVGSLDVDTDYTARIRQQIEALGLQAAVTLTGRVSEDELRGWYARAHVFALPARNVDGKFEGYGLVALEASAAGLPVIASRDCGAEDAVEHDVSGLLIAQASLDTELPAALIRLLSDPVLAARMGEAGRARAAQTTWDHTAQRLIEVYQPRLAEGTRRI